MSYLPTDTPYMSEEELEANGIKAKTSCSEKPNSSNNSPFAPRKDGSIETVRNGCKYAVDAWNKRSQGEMKCLKIIQGLY